jgi:hypothetical protein
MNTKTQAVDFAGISKNMRVDYAGNSPDVRNYCQQPSFCIRSGCKGYLDRSSVLLFISLSALEYNMLIGSK